TRQRQLRPIFPACLQSQFLQKTLHQLVSKRTLEKVCTRPDFGYHHLAMRRLKQRKKKLPGRRKRKQRLRWNGTNISTGFMRSSRIPVHVRLLRQAWMNRRTIPQMQRNTVNDKSAATPLEEADIVG